MAMDNTEQLMGTQHTPTPSVKQLLGPFDARYDSRAGVLPPGDWCVWQWPLGGDSGRRLVQGITEKEARAIATAINSHDALVEALKQFMYATTPGNFAPSRIETAREATRAALKAATEQS